MLVVLTGVGQMDILNGLCLAQQQWVKWGHARVGARKRMRQLLRRKPRRWVTRAETVLSPSAWLDGCLGKP